MRWPAVGVVGAILVALVPMRVQADTGAKAADGKAVYERWCVPCHGTGKGWYGATELPGTAALRAKYKGAVPPLLTDRKDLTPALVKTMVRSGVSVMPFFRKTEISDAELEALVAYLAHAK
jgi:mono/diheme cytochrome c family protein